MTDYEVELKFPLADATAVVGRLTELGATSGEPLEQIDYYFSHPVRDFAQTDEALRVRSCGAVNTLTYKGPLLDQTTKTRQELELPVEPGSDAARRMWAILRALGFEDVRGVSKHRHPYALTWEGRAFELAVDTVEGLGCFIEIETMTGADDWAQARDAALRLAAKLHLDHSERRSYLQLLMERDHSTIPAAGLSSSR